MSLSELFLHEIDTADGRIEVMRTLDQPYSTVSFGVFQLHIEDVDRDAVIGTLAKAVAGDADLPPLQLAGGDDMHFGRTSAATQDNRRVVKHVWIGSGCCHARIGTGAAALLLSALSELRAWHRRQLAATPTTTEAAHA